LTPDFNGGPWTEHWKIWIDFNVDGDFEDAGEEVFYDSSTTTVTGSLTIPTGLDCVTRMRVSMKYNSAPTPCETFSYGEVEDYTVNITPPGGQPPVADFTADNTTITEGESVNFTDLSTNNPDTWDWTFDGGTPATSTLQNPTITYNTAGTYTVTLTAANAYGSDTETKVDYITVNPAGQPPVAGFTASATTICAGDSVTFTDQSTNSPDAWDWSFPGGIPASSSEQNPTVTYNTPGVYSVTLTVSNAYGSDTETKTDYITVLDCPPCPGTINNPGFETGDFSSWTTVGDLSITSDAHTGSYAVILNGANSSVEQVITDLCANTTYTVSCWGKAKSQPNVHLGVKDYGGAEQTVQFTDFKNFVQKSITFTTGASNTSATIFFKKVDNKFDGTADDFEIVEN
jgi:PKD repeat protein